ncbi:hypothetical protein D3C85_1366380 [compost metagenome]
MKKIILMLLLTSSITFLGTSCKKDKETEKTQKEKTLELLVSAKWYFQSYKEGDDTDNCFNNTDYWEFKSDGTFNTPWFDEKISFTLNEDGKTFNFKYFGYNLTGTIVSIDENNLKFTLSGEDWYTEEYTLAKTPAKPCIS